MSGVGFWELMLVFLIGLIVLGPERLPRVASQLGTWLGQARRMTRMMRRQLEEELNLEKDLDIRPRPTSLPRPVKPAPPGKPDDWSPAHAAGAPGPGAGAGKRQTGAPSTGAEPAADPDPEAAEKPAEPSAQERVS